MKVNCGYSSTILDNLPGFSLICSKLAAFLLWALPGSSPIHQQRLHVAFGSGSPGSDSWHFFRSWLSLRLLTLYVPDNSEVDTWPSFCPWRAVAHRQASWPPARRRRKVHGGNVMSEDMGVFLNIILMLLTIILYSQ